MQRIWISIFLAALSSAPAFAAGKNQDYREADAGCLIYSVGTIKIGMRFTFPYGRIKSQNNQLVKDWSGKIEPKVGGAIYLKIKNPDFSGGETGHVVIRCLPPGEYEVGSFSFSGSVPGIGGYTWSPAEPFSLPFSIRSGEATYIGSFMRAPSLGTSLQPVLGAAGFFVIADRSERDLPIATGRIPTAMKVITEVTDVSVFGNPALRVNEP